MDFAPLSAALPSTPDGVAKPKNAVEAAQQFEALLLGQMLQNIRTAEDSEDPTSDTMMDMAAQQFAQVLSKNGGLGLAKMISSSIEKKPVPVLDKKP